MAWRRTSDAVIQANAAGVHATAVAALGSLLSRCGLAAEWAATGGAPGRLTRTAAGARFTAGCVVSHVHEGRYLPAQGLPARRPAQSRFLISKPRRPTRAATNGRTRRLCGLVPAVHDDDSAGRALGGLFVGRGRWQSTPEQSPAAHRTMRRRGAVFPAPAAVHGGPKRRWSRRPLRAHDSINH